MICAECDDFELRRDHPVLWARGRVMLMAMGLLMPRPSPATRALHGMASIMSIAAGGRSVRPPTHYERHRAEFERTGSVLELDRMLRQVES